MRLLACCSAFAVALAACGYEHERGPVTERTRGDQEAQERREGIRPSAAEDMTIGYSSSGARFVRNLVGFQGPESVKYDAEQDAWFVTNMTGAGSIKDGNGNISRISAADPGVAIVLAQGGRNGVVLDSPKGMAIHGDTLWTADISVLRGFERHTGAPLANIDFAPLGAVQLNDVAIGPDGEIRVTDTGIMMTPKGVLHIGPDRIFVVAADRAISVMTTSVPFPNGILWDPTREAWVVASFEPFGGRVYSLERGDGVPKVIRQHGGSGRLDGLERLADGALVFTSWADSSIHLLRGGTDRQIIREVPEAADLGYDTRRHQLAIPLSVLGRVQIWSMTGVESDRR